VSLAGTESYPIRFPPHSFIAPAQNGADSNDV
jgi:hypothetical protein